MPVIRPILLLLSLSYYRLAQCLFGRNAGDWMTRRHQRPDPSLHLPSLIRAGSSSSLSSGPMVEYEGDAPPTRALIFMDCFCPYHGLYLASRARQQSGVAIIMVLSDYLRGYLQATDPDESDRWEAARLPITPEEVQKWKAEIGKDVELVAVYCESDSGLGDAEILRQRLGVTCHDEPVILEARRNKYLMNECVKNAGLLTAKQKLCESLDDTKAFASQLFQSSDRVVVKPHRGVATESVYLATSLDEVESAWNQITSTKVYGTQERHSTVLVQEFLVGTEYAVDAVLRDGDYKVAAVWRYEKRPANGAAFCYFKTELVDQGDSNVEGVTDYVKAALNALGVKWGLSHNEVIVTERGPVLVEVNCRQHNMEFTTLTMACIGYNALDMTLDAFLGNDEAWIQYPYLPALRACGCMVHLVNYSSGTLVGLNHIEELDGLSSVFNWEIYSDFQNPGSHIEPTIDIRTDAGWVQLVNESPEGMLKDYNKIVAWMPTMFQVAHGDNGQDK